MKRPRSVELAVPHPRETPVLFGHLRPEEAFLHAFRSNRLPHAWLLAGPAGVGKATFAFRAARFVLAHADPYSVSLQSARDLAIAPEHPVFRRVASQAHPDLLVIERRLNEAGNLRATIAVDDVRRTVPFFGSSAGEGGWRVCIVDTADELNPAGANALLKIVEEPPSRSLFFILSSAAGSLLPTIRSRCRRLDFAALQKADLIAALAAATGRSAANADVSEAASLADGSIRRGLALLDPDARAFRQRLAALLAALPKIDAVALHALGDTISDGTPETLHAFTETVQNWLSAQLRATGNDLARLARLGEVWDKVNDAARDVEAYNLERKPLAFAVFDLLASAVRP